MAEIKPPRILIIGGGYGGLRVAITLQKMLKYQQAEVTLISKHDYHYQTTLLHKVAVGTLGARKARIFFRKVLDPQKVRFIKDKITKISPESCQVYGNGGIYEYDYLVIALGFKPDNFGIPGVNEYAYKLSSLNAALKLSANIEHKFKEFVHTKNELDLRVVVCGTGFTGIEFAAEMATELKELCLICGIDPSLPKVICIGRSEQILPVFSPKLSQIAKEKMEALGVEFICGGNVKECLPNGVRIDISGEEKIIEANTVLWGAGVKGSDIVEHSSIPNKRGRIAVTAELRCNEFENIFVVGDCAFATSKDVIHAPTAQLSAQMGDYVGESLCRILNQQSALPPFKFVHRGTVCSIGHTDGVGVVYGRSVKGELAAFMKNTIENRWLFGIGGFGMVFKKGQFRYRTSN
ncbi:NADH dehydrogenase FAD-containing subunit [Helicobacter monodelphidis]|uniref:NAD(P)/FAD-dependent oxidoreductase n=1 Tax=Helicobacter sp. 15-1451 TaxID=2004995 RepID=UPI000DCD4345|nr:NAD(P)/FAD-dependent oxidoreductase [Helicobacter sp. 15-1451]RAX58934.1 NADH dehydrogenase FAD-containing subunit [Helicobacter sp. 15-1451]